MKFFRILAVLKASYSRLKEKRLNAPESFLTIALHDLKAAFFIASSVVIISHFHFNFDIELDAIKLATSVFQDLRRDDSEASNTANVIAIDNRLYESYFNQSSPLERNKLTQILDLILKEESNRPKVLAIDIDLSPSPVPDASVDIFYDYFKQFKNTPIVLITPQKVVSGVATQTKADWLIKMCELPNIRFAFPYLPSVDNGVVHYWDAHNSFAYQVRAATYDAPNPSGQRTICDHIQQDPSTARRMVNNFYDTDPGVFGVDPEHDQGKLLNYKFIENIGFTAIKYETETPHIPEGYAAKIRDSVVFFGGNYGLSDIYETPMGNLPGIYLHAGTYFTIHGNKVNELVHIAQYVIEILITPLLGSIFYFAAAYYRKTHSLAAIVLNLVLHPLIFISYMLLSGFILYYFNFWLSVSFIIGMELHAIISGLEEPHVAIDKNRKLLGIPESYIKNAFYFSIIGWSWFILAQEVISPHTT